mgnify:CR=1 FL=1
MRIEPYVYQGRFESCCSKSHAQRILILAALYRKEVFIDHLFESRVGDDVGFMISAFRKIGYSFRENDSGLLMKPPKQNNKYSHIEINIGESGFGLRSFATVLSHFSKNYVLTGEKTILKRNHSGLIASIQDLRFHVESHYHELPIKITSPDTFLNDLHIDGSTGSQFLSGLLMWAIGCNKEVHIAVSNLKSIPYIDLTLDTISQFNGKVTNKGYRNFIIPGGQQLQCQRVSVEGDWSSMSFHLVGAALNGEVEIYGLSLNSKQADILILKVLREFGASVELDEAFIKVTKKEKKPFNIDLTDAPDLFPVLSILACGSNGKSRLTGTDRLDNKESNRLKSICAMLDVFQVQYELSECDIIIDGTGEVQGGQIDTFSDHRIAMSAICAGAISNSSIYIDNEDCVKKSYHNYFEDMFGILKNPC